MEQHEYVGTPYKTCGHAVAGEPDDQIIICNQLKSDPIHTQPAEGVSDESINFARERLREEQQWSALDIVDRMGEELHSLRNQIAAMNKETKR